MKRILDFLERRAKEFPPTSLLDTRAYAKVDEIATTIGANPRCVSQSLRVMSRSGSVRIYENGHKRKLLWGSIELPAVTQAQILELVESKQPWKRYNYLKSSHSKLT
ncbi:MAG: hypothetical protein ACRECH_18025 [Nitrososphaerales archaeon]